MTYRQAMRLLCITRPVRSSIDAAIEASYQGTATIHWRVRLHPCGALQPWVAADRCYEGTDYAAAAVVMADLLAALEQLEASMAAQEEHTKDAAVRTR